MQKKTKPTNRVIANTLAQRAMLKPLAKGTKTKPVATKKTVMPKITSNKTVVVSKNEKVKGSVARSSAKPARKAPVKVKVTTEKKSSVIGPKNLSKLPKGLANYWRRARGEKEVA